MPLIPSLLLYGADSRVRGLFNEGGPYGIFLVSAVLLVLLRIHVVRPVYPFVHKAAVVILLVALLLSGSKVGLLAAMSLCVIAALLSGGKRQMLALAGVLALLLTVFVIRFQGSLSGYLYAYLNFDEAYYYRPDDPSLIMGRIAATLIVPRMISAHPLLGIGVGNYSLMRNDPDYLQGLPPVDEWDLAGMGLLGSAAEFGIPLTLLLLALLIQPLVHARRRKAPLIVTLAAGFQPIAFLLGVNLNFFYPWLVAAFVLSLEPAGEAPDAGSSERGLNAVSERLSSTPGPSPVSHTPCRETAEAIALAAAHLSAPASVRNVRESFSASPGGVNCPTSGPLITSGIPPTSVPTRYRPYRLASIKPSGAFSRHSESCRKTSALESKSCLALPET